MRWSYPSATVRVAAVAHAAARNLTIASISLTITISILAPPLRTLYDGFADDSTRVRLCEGAALALDAKVVHCADSLR